MGRTGLSVAGIGAMYYNQAGLAGIKNWAADVSYERRFNLEDLTSIQISGAKNLDLGLLDLCFHSLEVSCITNNNIVWLMADN